MCPLAGPAGHSTLRALIEDGAWDADENEALETVARVGIGETGGDTDEVPTSQFDATRRVLYNNIHGHTVTRVLYNHIHGQLGTLLHVLQYTGYLYLWYILSK